MEEVQLEAHLGDDEQRTLKGIALVDVWRVSLTIDLSTTTFSVCEVQTARREEEEDVELCLLTIPFGALQGVRVISGKVQH